MDRTATAIADPVRREILIMVRDAPLSAGAIADRFPISRPAVSRHLRVLRESGLVSDLVVGRHRVYLTTPAPLADVAEWIAGFGPDRTWAGRLDALDTEVRRTVRDRRQNEGSVVQEETA